MPLAWVESHRGPVNFSPRILFPCRGDAYNALGGSRSASEDSVRVRRGTDVPKDEFREYPEHNPRDIRSVRSRYLKGIATEGL